MADERARSGVLARSSVGTDRLLASIDGRGAIQTSVAGRAHAVERTERRYACASVGARSIHARVYLQFASTSRPTRLTYTI